MDADRKDAITLANLVSSGENGRDRELFIEVAQANGYRAGAGGWVYSRFGVPVAHGWAALAREVIGSDAQTFTRTMSDDEAYDIAIVEQRRRQIADYAPSLIGAYVAVLGDEPARGIVIGTMDREQTLHVETGDRRILADLSNISLLDESEAFTVRNILESSRNIDAPPASYPIHQQMVGRILRQPATSHVDTSQSHVHVDAPIQQLAGFHLRDEVRFKPSQGVDESIVWTVDKLHASNGVAEAFASLVRPVLGGTGFAAAPLSRLERASEPEPAATVLTVHYMSDNLLDACGFALPGQTLTVTPVAADVTCVGCREIVRNESAAHKTREYTSQQLDAILRRIDGFEPDAVQLRQFGDIIVGRLTRRAKYDALRTMLSVADGWFEGAQDNHDAMGHRDADCCQTFTVEDIRRMVNDAAREAGTSEPYRPAT